MASRTFTYTGGPQTWTFPEGITQVNVQASGGGSGGRRGGRAAGTLKGNPGDTISILVGQRGGAHDGHTGGKGGFGGGANGGNGTGTGEGGSGGGGMTVVRFSDGLLLVAGGCGGTSGDSGDGGRGGGEEGEDGAKGTAGTGTVYDAGGGGRNHNGKGGSSGAGAGYAGQDGQSGVFGTMGIGGRGASVNKANSHGGGGGAGGFTSGGGGQASAVQDNPGGSPTRRFPGGGGGGGSNYVSPRLVGGSSARGTGSDTDGSVVLTWSDTPYTQVPPLPPTDVTVNGVPETDEMATSSMTSVTIGATLDDTNIGQQLRLIIQLYRDGGTGKSDILDTVVHSSYVEQTRDQYGQDSGPVKVSVPLTGLTPNTLYKARLYTADEWELSATYDKTTKTYKHTYTSISFWTNRPPNPPALTAPAENAQIGTGVDIPFAWNFSDPDGGNVQLAYNLRWRTARTPGGAAGTWYSVAGYADQGITLPASYFRGSTVYEWQVVTEDPSYSWGEWSRLRSFYIVAPAKPPQLVSPLGDVAVEVGASNSFVWTFQDLSSDVTQTNADLRYRVAGTPDWITLYGDVVNPGATGSWPMDYVDLSAYYRYEWQVRTYASTTEVSDWSTSGFFYAIPQAGSAISTPVVTTMRAKAPLGSGNNRAYIYDRGGKVLRGEITNIETLSWGRRRDDISPARVVVKNFEDDQLTFLASIESWQHELVIFRENGTEVERVFEGPITYVRDAYDTFEIQALDCMGYLKRRVIRQGYNDSYQLVDGIQRGLRSVVERASRIIKNALAYDDPNLIPYLTMVTNTGDAKQSRVVPDYSKGAWEEIDSLAQDAGLDYVTVGRRIVLWDTHNPIGRLPELRTEDFLVSPTLTQFGMQAASAYAVTDGSGIYGLATRGGPDGVTPSHGALEMLASAYGVTEGVSADPSTLTSAQIAAMEETFSAQAERNIAHRWPVPWEVRVPENARLSPETNIGINQLVPGVWIPVRARSRIRAIAQWQKLDQMTVTQTKTGESVTVVMNPAPNGGEDVDQDNAIEAAAEAAG